MEAFVSPQCLSLFLFLCIEVCLGQPIAFNSTIPFHNSTQSQPLFYDSNNEDLFIWPLHQDPAISNLSFPSVDPTPMWYYTVSAAFLGYVSNTTHDPAYVLSVVMTGIEGGALPENGMIVWMANRDNPVRGADPVLAIDQDKRLVLRSGNGEPVWWTNATGNQLELRGDGNLLLYDVGNQSKIATWQSFDYPADTWVMGQVMRNSARLTSRASTTDLSSGDHSLLFNAPDLDFSFFFAQDNNPNSVCYTQVEGFPPCATGLLGCAVLDFALGLSVSLYCSADCNNNRSPTPLTMNSSTPSSKYLASYPLASISNNTIHISRLLHNGDFVIYQSGRFSYWTSPQSFFATKGLETCLLPTRCNPYSTCFPGNNTCSTTCTTDTDESCMIEDSVPHPMCTENPNDDDENEWEMGAISGRSYISNVCDIPLNVTSPEQCQDMCYQNCSCTASFYDPHLKGCFFVTQKLRHLIHNSNSSYLAFIKMPSSASSTSDGGNPIIIIITVTLVSTMVLALSIIVGVVIVRKIQKPCESGECRPKEEEDDFLQGALHTVTRFSYEQIEAMTSGFYTKLGSGGFGSVYDGVLPNGQKVAVKRLDSVSGQGSKEFRAEVAIMAGIHHRNLVDLLGFCADNLHRLLVYEHMPYGSLDHWLFNTNDKNKAFLTWPQRFKIVVGVANGLAYLHEGCTKKIIHLDVKPQNILLDDNFDAKVGDFGLSRLLARDESFAMTTMRGTPGYLAPEWLREGGVTEKMDVYSFGMVLLELISGRKNYDVQSTEFEKRYFPVWAFDKLKENKEMELLDPKLANQLVHHEGSDKDHEQGHNDDEVMQFKRIIRVAFICTQEEPQYRPQMSYVVKMLEGGEMLPPLPLDHESRGFLRNCNMMATPITTTTTPTPTPSTSISLVSTNMDAR